MYAMAHEFENLRSDRSLVPRAPCSPHPTVDAGRLSPRFAE